MKLFDLNEDYEVVPDSAYIMLVPEFKALWELKYNKQAGDAQGRKRERGRKEIVYLYYFCDFKSVFSDMADVERRAESLAAAELPEDYTVSAELDAAIRKYKELQETKMMKLIRSAYGAVDKMRLYYDNATVDDNNLPKIIDSLGKLAKVHQGIKELEIQIMKDEKKQDKTRGDQERGAMEDLKL